MRIIRTSASLGVLAAALLVGGCGEQCAEPTGDYRATSVERAGGTCGAMDDVVGPIHWVHAEALPGDNCFGTRKATSASDLCDAQLMFECDDAARDARQHRRITSTLHQVDGSKRIEGTSVVEIEDYATGETCHSEYDVTITKL